MNSYDNTQVFPARKKSSTARMGNPRTARMMTADDADDRPTPTFTRRHVLGTLTIGSVALATLAIGCLALTAPRSSLSVARLDGECAGYVVQKGDSCWALTHSARPIEYLELDGVKYCCDGCSVDIAAGVCYECHGVGCNSQPGPGPSPSPPAVMTTPVIGTYYGAMPGNPALRPQPMSELSDAINMVMLSFAKDPENTGSFVPFASWIENKINYNSITADRAAYKARTGKERSYLISLGGAADSGGTFAIKPGMSASEWIENADASVTEIVHQYGAQGVEMQFEGGTGDVHFVEAMNTLLQRFQGKGFITAIGPWYSRWGTSGDYANVSPDHIDAVNMQMCVAAHAREARLSARAPRERAAADRARARRDPLTQVRRPQLPHRLVPEGPSAERDRPDAGRRGQVRVRPLLRLQPLARALPFAGPHLSPGRARRVDLRREEELPRRLLVGRRARQEPRAGLLHRERGRPDLRGGQARHVRRRVQAALSGERRQPPPAAPPAAIFTWTVRSAWGPCDGDGPDRIGSDGSRRVPPISQMIVAGRDDAPDGSSGGAKSGEYYRYYSISGEPVIAGV